MNLDKGGGKLDAQLEKVELIELTLLGVERSSFCTRLTRSGLQNVGSGYPWTLWESRTSFISQRCG